MSTLDTKLTAEEEKAVKDKVYETLSNNIKKVVDDLTDGNEENDQSAQDKMKQLSTRLDKGFYDYCKKKFTDQEVQDIKNAINTVLGKFPKNEDLIKLRRFVEGTKTFTDNTKTETFSGTGRLINSMNARPEQKKELDQNLKNLSDKIDTLDHNTNLYKLLDAMRTVTTTGTGGQNLQYYLYTDLPEDQQNDFLNKNAKKGVSRSPITPKTFDGIIGYYSLTEYIRNTNAKIDKYNQDKQDIDSNNDVFNQLMGNSDENTRIINEEISKAEAAKTQREQEEIEKKKIEAGLQNQTDFIEGIKEINDIPEEGKQKVSTKLQNLQARYDEEINRTNRNETLLRSLQALQKKPVLIYQRILIGEKIKERINTLQTNLQDQKIKPKDLTGTGFEIKNNLVVISSDFEKALKAANLWDEEEITKNKSQQRESRETFETNLLTKLTTIETQYKAYKKTIQSFKENAEKKYHCIITINDKECNIQRKGLYEGNTQETAQNNILNSRKQLRTQLDEKYKPIINQITNLQSHGVVFSEDGTASKIKNNANYEEIYNIIKTTVQDSKDQAEGITSGSTDDHKENATNPKVVEVTEANFDDLCNQTSFSIEQIKTLVAYANTINKHLYLNKITSLNPDIAKELAKYQGGRLSLSGITKLKPDIAKALANHQGGLSLNGITELQPDIAKALANHQGGLSLNGITELQPDIAEALANHQGGLSLDGITKLKPDIAKALANHKGGRLSLDGITELKPNIAEELANIQGTIYLRGLKEIDDILNTLDNVEELQATIIFSKDLEERYGTNEVYKKYKDKIIFE